MIQIILTAIVVALAFLNIGIRAGRRIEQRKQRKPVCLCTHTLSGHDKDTGACVTTVKRRKYNSIGM